MIVLASVQDWVTNIGPLALPLVLNWLETRGMRRELRLLRHEMRAQEHRHMKQQAELEARVTLLEERMSRVGVA